MVLEEMPPVIHWKETLGLGDRETLSQAIRVASTITKMKAHTLEAER